MDSISNEFSTTPQVYTTNNLLPQNGRNHHPKDVGFEPNLIHNETCSFHLAPRSTGVQIGHQDSPPAQHQAFKNHPN